MGDAAERRNYEQRDVNRHTLHTARRPTSRSAAGADMALPHGERVITQILFPSTPRLPGGSSAGRGPIIVV